MAYGKDIEGMLTGINGIKDAALDAIIQLASGSAYQMNHKSSHAGCGSGTCISKEVPHGASASIDGINTSSGDISGSIDTMKTHADNLYTPAEGYNNNYGSPFTELQQIKKTVEACVSYYSSNNPFVWLGQKAGMLALLNATLSMASDAKQSLTTYQDSAQRGFDQDSGEASIQWTKDVQGHKSQGTSEPVSEKYAMIESLGFANMDEIAGLPIKF